MANCPDKNKQIFGARVHKNVIARFDELAGELGLSRSDALRAYVTDAVDKWLNNGCTYSAAEKEKIQEILDNERRVIRKSGQAKIPRRKAVGG